MEIDPFYVDIPCVHCPYCGERYQRAEDLEVHRERHQPIPSKEKGSSRCLKGCGRCLMPDTAAAQAHLALCDGSPPLNGIFRAMGKKWFCQAHGYGTDGPKMWGIHVKEHHEGVDPRKPFRKQLREPKEPEAVAHAVELLRAEQHKMRQEILVKGQDIERLESAIKILEKADS